MGSNERINGTVDAAGSGVRCDIFLSEIASVTRAKAQRMIADGDFTVEGRPVKKNRLLSEGESYEYILSDDPVLTKAVPQDIDIEVVYEDEHLAVVNKPKGMVVHPAAGNHDGTLVNALLYKLGDLSTASGLIRPGIVHRIDKNTSGLLVVAKDEQTHLYLADLFAKHDMVREYRGIIIGETKEPAGTVDAPIGRSPSNRKKMAVTQYNSKNAVTHYKTIVSYGAYSFMKFNLETGRTHQIRVHMSYIGHPILGDDVYGGVRKEFSELEGQCLHAFSIGFVHPVTGKEMYFESKLPQYFTDALNKLENKYGGI